MSRNKNLSGRDDTFVFSRFVKQLNTSEVSKPESSTGRSSNSQQPKGRDRLEQVPEAD